MENKITQIVLLGGGYASIWAYRSLIKALDYEILFGDVRIIVVCPDDHHFFHGWTAESLTCIVQDKNRMSPLANIFSKAHLIKGVADEINYSDNLVYVKTPDGSMETIYYDHLLIGTGSYDSDQIEGINQYGYKIKSHESFLKTKKNIQSIVTQAAGSNNDDAKKLLSFTICGSGFSGIELVTNIAEFIAVLKKQYHSLKNVKPLIRLINSKDQILDSLNPRLKRMKSYAEKVMSEYGIKVINNKKVSKVIYSGAFLNDNSFIESSMVISAIGQSRVILKGTENMKRDSLNRLCVNTFLQVDGHPNIWGGGDACSVMHYKTKKPCIPNALWAIKHGEYAGKNIARAIKSRTLKPFNYKGLGQCASLGIGRGMGELYGFEFTGWVAWIMRWFFFNYFMPSRKVMMNEITDWMYLLFSRKRRGLKMQQQPNNSNGKSKSINALSFSKLVSKKNITLNHEILLNN